MKTQESKKEDFNNLYLYLKSIGFSEDDALAEAYGAVYGS